MKTQPSCDLGKPVCPCAWWANAAAAELNLLRAKLARVTHWLAHPDTDDLSEEEVAWITGEER